MLDQTTRRIQVRATIDNEARLLKPEMFARVSIITGDEGEWPAVPMQAVIFEGDTARVWLMNDAGAMETRQIKTGIVNGDVVQVLSGVRTGERVITKGSIFIDRVAGGAS